jgi:hypothetical protein
MLSFAVFDDHGPAPEWTHGSMYVIGHDGAPLGSPVRFADGHVHCDPPGEDASAIAVQWPVGDCGILMLQTCLLPQRMKPYVLSLELARHRIMLYLTKLEEWGRFEAGNDTPSARQFAESHQIFMEALAMNVDGSPDDMLQQDRLAREALRLAVEASENLTNEAAESWLESRLQTFSTDASTPVPAILGCTIDPERFADPLTKVVTDGFDFMVAPLRWKDLEPEEGKYKFAPSDRWIEWAVRRAHIPVTGGPLIDLSPEAAPDWIYIWEHDYETLRELIYEHVKRVVTRYRRAVSKWTVCSGLHLNANIRLSLEQMLDLTRLVVLVARKLHPHAKIQVEIDRPFGETSAVNDAAIPPSLYAELLAQAGIEVDCIGLRVQMGDAAHNRPTRDLMQYSSILDHFALFERPVSVSMLGAPSGAAGVDAPSGDDGLHVEAGHWRSDWNEAVQAEWMTKAISIALSKPFVTSVAWQSLYDTPDGRPMPLGGLITQTGQPKKGLARMMEIHKVLRSRHGLGGLPPLLATAASASSALGAIATAGAIFGLG